MKTRQKNSFLLTGLVLSGIVATHAQADVNPFALVELEQGYMQLAEEDRHYDSYHQDKRVIELERRELERREQAIREQEISEHRQRHYNPPTRSLPYSDYPTDYDSKVREAQCGVDHARKAREGQCGSRAVHHKRRHHHQR